MTIIQVVQLRLRLEMTQPCLLREYLQEVFDPVKSLENDKSNLLLSNNIPINLCKANSSKIVKFNNKL
jgi:hypothetical protein